MKSVLILGNGISRTTPESQKFIREWEGELWGCNRVYLDLGHRLTRLTGHIDVMREAREYKASTGCGFEIWGGHTGGVDDQTRCFTCPIQFRKDSGTTLVAQALEEGFQRVVCCGFDLGGPDMYSSRHREFNKKNWVLRWRGIAEHYGLDRVEFVGHDHKPFILSEANASAYPNRYLRGLPHLPDPAYRQAFGKFTGWKPEDRGDRKMKVRFVKKDFVTELNEEIARRLIHKGEAELVQEAAAPAPTAAGAVTTPRKRERPAKKAPAPAEAREPAQEAQA